MMLQSAVDMISDISATRITGCSGVYETEPWGYRAQPPFYNACIGCETELSIQNLFIRLKGIERELGRTPSPWYYPRVIDIDILLCDQSAGTYGEVVIPHASMDQRRFVLAPLNEIAPDAMHPVFQRTISELLKSCPDDAGIRKVSDRLDTGNTGEAMQKK